MAPFLYLDLPTRAQNLGGLGFVGTTVFDVIQKCLDLSYTYVGLAKAVPHSSTASTAVMIFFIFRSPECLLFDDFRRPRLHHLLRKRAHRRADRTAWRLQEITAVFS